MADLASPLDDHIVDLTMLEGELEALLGQDGWTARERRVFLALRASKGRISAFRRRERAVSAWVKTGKLTDFARRNFREAGVIVSLVEERQKRRSNVIAFPTASNDSGPQAA